MCGGPGGGGRGVLPPSPFFWPKFSCILSASFLEISAQGHLRSGHHVRSSDRAYKKIFVIVFVIAHFLAGYVFQGINIKLSGIVKAINTYKA